MPPDKNGNKSHHPDIYLPDEESKKCQGLFVNLKIYFDVKTELTVYCRNAAIQEGTSYKMVKLDVFHQIFSLACTSSGGVISGR